MNFLLSLALNFISNPLLKSIITNVINLLLAHASDLVPLAVEEIKKAAHDESLKNAEEKYIAVYNALSDKFPEIGASIISTVIEVSYNYLKTSRSI